MAGDERTAAPDLSAPAQIEGPAPDARLQRLAARPEAHHLFLALRLIEAVAADRPRLGRSLRPREDAVRLGQDPELAFPTSTLSAFRLPQKDAPGALRNRFFGLFGPQGPLPIHLTEYARDRQRNWRDPTLVAFADLFHHRLMSLFYRAWASAEPAPSFDRADDDPFARRVEAISGRLGAGLAGRDAMPDLAKLHFAGFLASTQKHEAGLEAMVTAFFRVPVRIESFVGSWLHLEPDDRWRLGEKRGGRPAARLGGSTGIGGRVWSRQAKFRFRIGPMGLEEFRRLLPGGESLKRLTAIVRNYLGDTLEWEANLVLRAGEVPECRLGQQGALGLTSWIGRRPPGRDADELYLLPQTGSAA